MPANTTPIFSLTPAAEWTTQMTAANTGNVTGNTSYLVYSAGTNGSYVQKIRFRHLPTVTNSAPTAARVWINNGSDRTVAANNTLWDEITIAANTLNSAAASVNYELPLNFALPPNYAIYVTLGVAPTAGASIQATVIGGDY
jgi:hypothetical protein